MHRIGIMTALALAVLAAPAAAQERYQVRIVYGDLDLMTQAGADEMFERIEGAARDVCNTGRARLAVRPQQRACMRDFSRTALSELNRAAPQRVYAQREPNAAVSLASR